MSEGSHASDRHSLFDKESASGYWKLTTAIVNVNHCAGCFLRSVDILFKSWPHAWNTLVNATPGFYNACFLLLLVRFELDRLFPNSDNLLVLHTFTHVKGVYDSFYEILNFGFGTLSGIDVLVVDWAGHTKRQGELKRNSVRSGIQKVAWNFKHTHFVVGETMDVFDPLPSFLISIHPIASECSFLTALNFDLDMSCCEWLHRFNEDLAVYDVSGFIERKFGLHLNSAFREGASCIWEVKHWIK